MSAVQLLALAGVGAGGLGAGLLALRQPAILVALSVFTISLDYKGRLGEGFITANNLLKVVLIGAFLVQMLCGGRRLRLPIHLILFLPYLVFAAISSYYSAGFLQAGFYVMRLTLVWIYAVLVANLIEREWQLSLLLVAMAATALFVSVTAHMQTLNIVALAGAELIQKQGPDAGSVRALGTFWDANALGGFLGVLSLFLMAGLARGNLGWIRRGAILCVLGVAFGAVLLSFSRSAWLMIAFGMLLFAREHRLRPYVGWFLALGLCGALYVLIATPYGHALTARFLSFGELGQDYSGRFRWYLALSGLEIWADGMHWLWGSGFYSFGEQIWRHWYPLATHDMMYHSGTNMSHTLLVTLLAEGGLLGVLLFVVPFMAALRALGRLRRQPHGQVAGSVLLGCQVVLMVKLVDTFFNPLMYDNLIWLTMGLIGAIAGPAFPPLPAGTGGGPERAVLPIDPPAAQC